MARTPETLESIARHLNRTNDENEREQLLIKAHRKLRDFGYADATSVELPGRPSLCDIVLQD